jgi:competence protein ComEC
MDDIRQKLAQIDKQLAGRNFHKQIINTCPLLFAAVGLIVGILIQDKLVLPILFWMVPLVLLSAASVYFFVVRRFSKYCRYILAYMALVCFACLGAVRLADFNQPKSNDIRNFIADQCELATIRGLIVTEPRISEYSDWKFARFVPTDPTSSFYLRINEVKTVDGWSKVTGTVRVLVNEPVLDLKAGDFIKAYCWLERFEPPTNPGQFDTARYLASRNVFIGAYIKMREGIELLSIPPAGNFTRLKAHIRQTAERALLGDLPREDTSRALLQALLLGYRGDIDSNTYRAFRETGLLHFISLSGLHFGILIGIIWWLCKTVGLTKPARAIICIIAIFIFLMIVPSRAPTLRAAVICFVFCLSFLFRRHSNPINTLSLAAIILLLIRPTQLFEPGWQLSFTSVLGILLFTGDISSFLRDKILKLLSADKLLQINSSKHLIRKFADKVITLFSVGFAAWLGGAGILLYHFYTVTPLASVWTILVFPLVGGILILGFFKMMLFFVLPTLGTIIGFIVAILSDFLIHIVKFIADLNISQILIGRVSPAIIILYYFAIIFAGFAYFRRPMVKKTICVSLFLAIIIFLGFTKWKRTSRDNLILTSLDVGHGQAIFVQLPGRDNLLFDAGSLYKADVGRRIVLPFMNYNGTNKISAVIISHNDTDHINAIPEVAESCRVGRVYANDDFFDKTDQWGTAKFLSDCLKETGFKIKRMDEDLNFGSEADIKILWPRKGIHYDKQLSDNDRSLVTLMEFAGKKILLCSDIEQYSQKELMNLYPEMKADVVIVPHHGSVNTLAPGFLEGLNADILICSGEEISQRQWLCTSTDGAISLSIEKNGEITVRTNK